MWTSWSSGWSSRSEGTLMSWRMSGRRVTMPLPRGRKSLPTMFSRTDDLPEDCEPTTTCVRYQLLLEGRRVSGRERTICGRSRESFPMVLKTRSCSLLTVCSRLSPREAMIQI